MAGHSKWANIKHRKAAQDAKKGKVFTKIARELTVAAKQGGGDATANPRLRLALDKARAANMPRDNVERAIKKGTGDGMDQNFEDVTYEAYGPAGVGILVKVLTDNRNRSITDVRTAVTKRGGSMAEAGSVSWQFDMKGVLEIDAEKIGEDDIMELAIEAGAEDVVTEDGLHSITTAPSDFDAVLRVIDARGITPEYAEVTMKPRTLMAVGSADAQKIMAMVEALEDLDDVQDVYGNYDIDEADLED
jgi:YebC/PmpR family DNA-binding regulatory protein